MTMRHPRFVRRGSLLHHRPAERGYLIEYQLLFALALVGLIVTVTHLPALWARIVLALIGPVLIFCLHYMLLTPGWRPGNPGIRRPWNLILFVFWTVVIVACMVAVLCL